MKEVPPYDDISANYSTTHSNRPDDDKSTMQKEEFPSKVNVSHSLNSAKCGSENTQNVNLSSNRWSETTSLLLTLLSFLPLDFRSLNTGQMCEREREWG